MMKDIYRYMTLTKRLTVAQQKTLCVLAYLGKYYHTNMSQDRLLKWIEVGCPDYKNMLNELSTKGWLVEELPHKGAVPILLVNPKRLLDILDFLLIVQPKWKAEIEGLVPKVSPFCLFENLVLAIFESDIPYIVC